MKLIFATIVLSLVSATGYCDFTSYFEIKFNQVSIYNSAQTTNELIQMEYDSIKDTDLFEIKYYECGMSVKNYYELHIKIENSTVDLTFISDEPEFILNMGWLTQFKNRKASIYLHHTKYNNNSSQDLVHKVADLIIS